MGTGLLPISSGLPSLSWPLSCLPDSSTNLLTPRANASASPSSASPLPAHRIRHSPSTRNTYPTLELAIPNASLTPPGRPFPDTQRDPVSNPFFTIIYLSHASSATVFFKAPTLAFKTIALIQVSSILISTLCHPSLALSACESIPPGRKVPVCRCAHVPVNTVTTDTFPRRTGVVSYSEELGVARL